MLPSQQILYTHQTWLETDIVLTIGMYTQVISMYTQILLITSLLWLK